MCRRRIGRSWEIGMKGGLEVLQSEERGLSGARDGMLAVQSRSGCNDCRWRVKMHGLDGWEGCWRESDPSNHELSPRRVSCSRFGLVRQ